jgi:plastocyanin
VVVAAAAGYHPANQSAVDSANDPQITVQQGTNILFFNADPIAPHTLSAIADEFGNYAFDTGEPTAMGKWSFVEGVENLAPGRYQFQCKLHTSLMHGWITVVPQSAPV